jgi:hypothetical protein
METSGLRGADVFLDEPSVTGTENALMAAVAAQGTTILRNAASEPHVQDLCHFLVALGARIEGIGTNTVTVHGGATLGGATHAIGPDHIEVGSFIGLAAATRSELRIVDAGVEHLRSTLMAFERLGITCRVDGADLVVPAEQERVVQADLGGHVPTIADQPWPAFPADTMSTTLVAATQCEGMVLFHEKMFESRLFFVDKLIGMGARIVLCDPHRAIVSGPAKLRAATVESPDIRAGMAMLPRRDVRRGTERHQQRRPDRARLRAHRRAPQRARRAHPARRGPPRTDRGGGQPGRRRRRPASAAAPARLRRVRRVRRVGRARPRDDARRRLVRHRLRRAVPRSPAGGTRLLAHVAAAGVHRCASRGQVHGAEVLVHVPGWRGWLRGPAADGHVALERATALGVSVADCVPVYVAHPSGAVAMLHSGWRSTAANILGVAVRRLAAAGRARATCASCSARASVGGATR